MEVHLVKQRVDTDNYRGSEIVGFVLGTCEQAEEIVQALNDRDPEVGEQILSSVPRRNSYYRVPADEVTMAKVEDWFPDVSPDVD